MSEPLYEIHGGCLDEQSFWDGGPAYHLEDCLDLQEARDALSAWHKANYAAWIVSKANGQIIPAGMSHIRARAPAASPCGKMREALEFIRDGYERTDINHVDYRVGAYMAALDALDGNTSSDGEGEAGSSPTPANRGHQRDHAHGVMPVGDIADAMDRIEVGPSEAYPRYAAMSEPVAWQYRTLYGIQDENKWGPWFDTDEPEKFKDGIWKSGIDKGTIQLRALYAAPTTSPNPVVADHATTETSEQTKAACPHCDDTGDVHRADGEWLGSCGCKSPEPDAVRGHIDARLLDLENANAATGPHSRVVSAQEIINRNQREIRSLKDLRSLAALSRPAHGGWEDNPVYDACAKALADKFKDTADGHFREDVIAACVRTIQHAERWRDSGRAVQAALARNDRQTGGTQS